MSWAVFGPGTRFLDFPNGGSKPAAGLCPRNDESAGKRRSNRMRKGAPWLKTTLVQCAWAAVRTKGSYLQAQFHRLRSRRGAKKAIGAVAASILTAAYHMLKDGTCYEDLGHDYFDQKAKAAQTNRLVARLKKPRLRRRNHTNGGIAGPTKFLSSDADKDALLMEQAALIERMAARIAELEAAIGKPKKTSSNSHTPPSKDGPGRKNRKRDEDRPRKQRPSRPGVSRPLAEDPDKIERRMVACCPHCGTAVAGTHQV